MRIIESPHYFYIDYRCSINSLKLQKKKKIISLYAYRKKLNPKQCVSATKIYADVVTATAVLSFGGFFVSLSLFVCKWLPGNRVIDLDHQLLPTIPQGIN